MESSGERIRVLRISHASLTPALRQRERALARAYPDIDLEIVTAERWREAEVDVEALDDDLFPVVKARTRFSKHIQLFAYDARPLIAALRGHRPHLIDLNHEPYSIACAEILTLCRWFAPQAMVILQPCQNILHRYPPPFNWLEWRALRRAVAAHTCSESVREVLCIKGFKKPVAIVPFGVDVSAFTPRPLSDQSKPLTIGYVGRMLPGKGVNILGDALSQLKTENWKLLVVGDGSEREPFERALAEHGLLDRAEFTGAISYSAVPPQFQKIDILVVPTETTKRIREQFGRVIVEAMASGVPVIGSTCGAIPEVIDTAGLVVPEGDAMALAEGVRKLLADPELRERLARAGRRRAEEHYTWERVAEQTYDLYQLVLRTHMVKARAQNFGFAAESEGRLIT